MARSACGPRLFIMFALSLARISSLLPIETMNQPKSPPVAPSRPHLPVLTTLRFFAAMEVVLFHLYLLGDRRQTPLPFSGLLSGGYEAVSFFFILSGFVLTYASVDDTTGHLTVSRQSFWIARIGRIAPAYFLGLALALPILLHLTFITKFMPVKNFVEGVILTPFALQAWWPPAATVWNFPGWSLSVEAFFYALFPWLTVATVRLRPTGFLVAAYFLILGTTIGRAALSSSSLAQEYPSWPDFLLYFPVFHLPKFILGMALARYFMAGHSRFRSASASLLYLGSLSIMIVFACRSSLPTWMFSDAVLCPLCAFVIAGAAGGGREPKILASPFLVLLGEASYLDLYSPRTHWVLVALACYEGPRAKDPVRPICNIFLRGHRRSCGPLPSLCRASSSTPHYQSV